METATPPSTVTPAYAIDHGDRCDRLERPLARWILYLRQHYHFGPARVAAYLHRFHAIEIAGSSVHRILKRHGLNRLPANQKRICRLSRIV